MNISRPAEPRLRAIKVGGHSAFGELFGGPKGRVLLRWATDILFAFDLPDPSRPSYLRPFPAITQRFFRGTFERVKDRDIWGKTSHARFPFALPRQATTSFTPHARGTSSAGWPRPSSAPRAARRSRRSRYARTSGPSGSSGTRWPSRARRTRRATTRTGSSGGTSGTNWTSRPGTAAMPGRPFRTLFGFQPLPRLQLRQVVSGLTGDCLEMTKVRGKDRRGHYSKNQ